MTYIEGIEKGTPVFEQESLDADTRYNELVMTALRTCEGLNLHLLTKGHKEYCLQQARRFVDDGLLQAVDDHLRLTHKGLFVSNMMMSELMKIE
jgi:oxygen-independent coproporphyrinogen-3 oxidase